MDLRYLCTNCMQGTLQNGVCKSCGKKSGAGNRTPDALPERTMLASRYYLGKVLGRGGFGITYLAWDLIGQRRVVVKELYPAQIVHRDPVSGKVRPEHGEEERYQKYRQRFWEEAQLLYSLRDEPAILNVYSRMEENNTFYYSMELLTGYDLRNYVEMQREKKLSWMQLSGYVRQILYTLRILHGKGLIHRDISPDNIFLTGMNTAKLIDFGSVRCYGNNRMTELLKQDYAPLEQYFSNGRQGPWTDIFSLSVVMYHVLTGVLPPSATERKLKGAKPRPIQSLCPELPEHIAAAIMKGMEAEITDRFSDVAEMTSALFPGENIILAPSRQERGTPGYLPAEISHSEERRIKCVAGVYRGRQFKIPVGVEMTIGRERQCAVSYPANCPGVSRRHFTLRCDSGGALYIRDEHSSYGTLVAGRRLEPGVTYRIERGSVISFAGEEYYVE